MERLDARMIEAWMGTLLHLAGGKSLDGWQHTDEVGNVLLESKDPSHSDAHDIQAVRGRMYLHASPADLCSKLQAGAGVQGLFHENRVTQKLLSQPGTTVLVRHATIKSASRIVSDRDFVFLEIYQKVHPGLFLSSFCPPPLFDPILLSLPRGMCLPLKVSPQLDVLLWASVQDESVPPKRGLTLRDLSD